MSKAPVFTQTSAYSLGFVGVVGTVAYILCNALLPRSARWQDKFTFIWLVSEDTLWGEGRDVNCATGLIEAFDAMIHFTFEGSFLYLSTIGGTVNENVGPFAELCMCHAHHSTHLLRHSLHICFIREGICARRCSLGVVGPYRRLS